MAKTPSKENQMAEDKTWNDPKKDDKQDKDKKDPLAATLAKQRSSQSNTISPTPEETEGLEDKLFKKEEEKDGVITLTSSIDEGEAEKAKTAAATVPDFINMRQALDRVPGVLDLTKGGTLNNDMSMKMDIEQEEWNELASKTAGPNPMPNRIGNELTKIENGFRADQLARNDANLAGLPRLLKKVKEGAALLEEDKKELEKIEKGLSKAF